MRERKSPPGAVAQFQPRPADLVETIQRLAENTGLVFFSDHALERMEEREITQLDALRVLRSGRIVGDITAGKAAGEWKCKVVARLKGNREAGVATITIQNARLLVKTVEWEDVS